MADLPLDLLVVLLPFLLSVFGVLVTLEPWNQRHKPKWRIGLMVFGLAVSVMTYYQQARQRTRSDKEARELREQVVRQERESNERFDNLTSKVNSFVAESIRQSRLAATVIPKVPSAEEIAAEIDKRLTSRLPQPTPTSPTIEKTPLLPKPTTGPASSNPVASSPTIQPCRGDRLNECSDEQLLEWGKSLIANIGVIHNDYMTDTKKLDDIRGGNWNWLREFVGVGDKDSKWLKGFDLAQKRATDRFRDCCAERALAYHKELLQRDHERPDNTLLYEWIQNLLKPVNSREWKKAREDAPKVGDVYFDLNFFQINLEYAVSKRHIGS
jgi:hypothetical protein